MRVLLCTVCLLIAYSLPSVYCQEDGRGSPGPWWQKAFEFFKKFFGEFQTLLSELKDKIQERTKDIRDWTKEVWTGLKEEWNNWVKSRNDMSESEKMELMRYIDNLKMPEKEDNQS